MNTQLTFTEELAYDEDPDGIPIPVTLSYGIETAIISAKIDTGAGVCLFTHEIGLQLGVPIEQGIPIVLSGISGGSLEAFGHEVTIQTGDLSFQSIVYFAKHRGLPRNFLGRQGWLRNIKLALVDYDNLLYLSAYDS
jgi:hypothetical protein